MKEATTIQQQYRSLPVDSILVNDNIRKTFDEEQLNELAASLKEYGVLQPLVVRPLDGEWGTDYVLVAGERRLRAAKIAGLAEVPCRVVNLTAKQAAEVQLLENLQRTDLNALEEANALQGLMEEHGYTQEALADKLGKSQSWVAGRVKLLDLPESVQRGITRGIVNPSAAEVLARYCKAAPEIIEKVVEGMKDKPIPVAKLRDEVDWRVAQKCKPLDDRSSWDKPVFDASECLKNCPKAILLREFGSKDERPKCADPKCWDHKNQAAKEDVFRQAILSVGADAINLDSLDYNGKYTSLREWNLFDECSGCEHRRKGIRRSYSGETETLDVCLDPKCNERYRAAKQEAQQKAADQERQAKTREYQEAAKAANFKFSLGFLPHSLLASLAHATLMYLGWDPGIPWSVHSRDIEILRKLDAMPHADLVGLLINTLVERRVRDKDFAELDYLLGKPLPEVQGEGDCDEDGEEDLADEADEAANEPAKKKVPPCDRDRNCYGCPRPVTECPLLAGNEAESEAEGEASSC